MVREGNRMQRREIRRAKRKCWGGGGGGGGVRRKNISVKHGTPVMILDSCRKHGAMKYGQPQDKRRTVPAKRGKRYQVETCRCWKATKLGRRR